MRYASTSLVELRCTFPCSARKVAQKHCAGKRIKHALFLECGGGPRDGLFDDIVVVNGGSADEAAKVLVGRKIMACHRHGKQQWWELDGAPHVCWHFGMTGAFSIKGLKGSEFVRYSVSTEQWPPRFTKVLVTLHDGTELAFTDPRRLGRVKFVMDPRKEPPVSELGWDPYLSMRPLTQFQADLAARALPIKALLLSQDYVAGIGNWIADEVLYQAKIHPETTACTLDGEDVSRLHSSISSVVNHAVSVDAESKHFPKEWLFHYRWGKGKGGCKMPDGNPIEFVTVGGRTSAVVRAVQGAPQKGGVKVTAAGSSGTLKKGASSSAAASSTAMAVVAQDSESSTVAVKISRKRKAIEASSTEAAGGATSTSRASASQEGAAPASDLHAAGSGATIAAQIGKGSKRRRPLLPKAALSSTVDPTLLARSYGTGTGDPPAKKVIAVVATSTRKLVRS